MSYLDKLIVIKKKKLELQCLLSRHTPDLPFQELLLHREPPVLLLVSFNHLLLVHQLIFLCHRLQLLLRAGAAQGIDARLVAVELSQH